MQLCSLVGLALAMLAFLGGPARAASCPDSSYPYLGSENPPHWTAGVRTRRTTTLLGGTQTTDDCDADSSLVSWLDTGASPIVGTAQGNALASLSQGKLHASDLGRATNLFDYSHAKAILADRLTVRWDGTGTPPTPVPSHPGSSYVPITLTMHVNSLMGIQVDAGLTEAQLMNQRLTVASHATMGFLDESGLYTLLGGVTADFTRHVEYDFTGTMLTDEVTAQNYGDTGSTFDGGPLAKGASTTISTAGFQDPNFPADIVSVQKAVIGQALDINASLESVIGKSPYGAPVQESTSPYMQGTLALDATFTADLPTGYHLYSESGVFLPEPDARLLEEVALCGVGLVACARRRTRPR